MNNEIEEVEIKAGEILVKAKTISGKLSEALGRIVLLEDPQGKREQVIFALAATSAALAILGRAVKDMGELEYGPGLIEGLMSIASEIVRQDTLAETPTATA